MSPSQNTYIRKIKEKKTWSTGGKKTVFQTQVQCISVSLLVELKIVDSLSKLCIITQLPQIGSCEIISLICCVADKSV